MDCSFKGKFMYIRLLRVGALLVACLSLFIWSQNAGASSTWQIVRSTVATRGLAYNGSVYISAASNGIWSSSDAKNWQKVTLPSIAGVLYSDVVWDGSQFIAVGNGIITSTDGVTWTVRQAPDISKFWYAICNSNGTYIAVGRDGTEALRSTDGDTWTAVSTGLNVTGSTYYSLSGVASNGTGFVAMGFAYTLQNNVIDPQSDVVLTTTDGKTWTVGALPFNGGGGAFASTAMNSVAWGNGTYVGGGSTGVYTSSDGVTWVAVPFPASDTWVFNRITWTNGQFVALGTSFSSSEVGVFTSTDGATWNFTSLGPRGGSILGTNAMIYTAGKYVVAGYSGVFSSGDLSKWSPVFTGPQTNLSTCIGYGGGQFIVPGSHGDLVSTDGITWPDAVDGSGLNNNDNMQRSGNGCMAYGAGVFVVTFTGWSQDGLNYYPPTTSLPINTFDGIVWDGKRFITVDVNPTTNAVDEWTSADGKSWSSVSYSGLPTASVQFGTGLGNGGGYGGGGLAYQGNIYFAWGTSNNAPFLVSSKDGAAWSTVKVSLAADDVISGVAFGQGVYTLIGNHADGSTFVYVSKDDTSWTAVSGLPSGILDTWNDITWGGNEFVAVGETSYGQGVILSSTDGNTWTAQTQESADLSSIVWSGTSFVSVSAYDIVEYTPPASSTGSSSGSTGGTSGSGSGSSGGSGGGGGAFGLFALTLLAGSRVTRRTKVAQSSSI